MILLRLIIALALSLPVSSWAAIAFVSHTEATATQNVSSVTFPLTVPAGTDRGAFVCSQARHNATPGKSITGVTFNGTEAFTLVRADTKAGFITAIWRLAAPTVTTANVVVTYSGANVDAIGVSATLLTGVSQSSPVDSHAGSNGSSTAIAATITTIADNAWIIDCAVGQSNTGLTVGAGQTMRTDRLIGSVVIDGAGASTVNGKTPAGAESMNWTQSVAQDWAISAVSIAPSGGSDPTPTEPSQVTLTWVNGTDPGTDPTGIASTTVRRGTGPSCDGATSPAIGTVTFPATTFVDTTVQTDTTYCYSCFHTDGAGNVSTNHATVRVTTSGTPAASPPTIASVVVDATGATLAYGAVTPTQIEVVTYTNLQVVTSEIHEMADFPSGRFTQTWRDGLQGVCFTAIGSTGLKNKADNAYICKPLTAIVGAADTTPPTLSNCQPTGTLPAGTTSWTFSCNVNKPNTTARYDTTDIAYASMANLMAINSLTFSGTKTGLSSAAPTIIYIRPQLLGLSEIEEDTTDNYPALTSTVVTLTVAASTADVTPPADVTGLAGTLIGNAVTLTWSAAADAVSYQVYQASGDCSTYAPAGNPTALTSTQLSLSFSTVYCWKVKAYDVALNLSTNFSSVVTKTTLAAPDIERPSDLAGMTVRAFTRTVLLSWTRGIDNSGQVFANIEFCAVETGQMDCANFAALVGEISQIFLTPQNLTPGARYCYRGKNSDPTGNVSLNYNTPICETTPTTGLSAPRGTLPFGVERATGVRGTADTRALRP